MIDPFLSIFCILTSVEVFGIWRLMAAWIIMTLTLLKIQNVQLRRLPPLFTQVNVHDMYVTAVA